MALYLREVIKIHAEGKQHWLDVVAGKKKPMTPPEYAEGEKLRWFARGAVEAMEERMS